MQALASPVPPFSIDSMRTPLLLLLGALVVTTSAAAHDFRRVPNDASDRRVATAVSDSQDVATVITRFHSALAAGDSTGALTLLAADATILESGGVETRSEYQSHHLPGDVAYARAVPSRRGAIDVRVQGDVAWAFSTSITEGEFRGRAINSAGAELVVLSREAAGWRIRAIHWSSRARR